MQRARILFILKSSRSKGEIYELMRIFPNTNNTARTVLSEFYIVSCIRNID